MPYQAKIIIAVLLAALFLNFGGLYNSKRGYSMLKNNSPIQKIEIKWNKGFTNITDQKLLNVIDSAFKEMRDTSKFYAGLSDVSAWMSVYKSGMKVAIWIGHSPYYGWMLSVEERKNFSCPYLFRMIDSLQRTNITRH